MATNAITSSTINRQKVLQHLRNFNFKGLFVQELGWDILREQPVAVIVNNASYVLHPLVEKRGVKVYVCDPDTSGKIPNDVVLRKIEREVTRLAYEHFIIYVDTVKENQVWQWVKRDQGKRAVARINRYRKGQSGELLAQKLERLAVGWEEEGRVHMAEMTGRVARAFDVERVTKKFYDRFKLEHAAFLKLIQGLEDQADREWYASLMLNRLMFIYFIQRKGFLGTREPGKLDGDPDYLFNRLKYVQQHRGEGQFHTFYRYFLLKLFHDGLSQRNHSPELEALLGKVPYLNGGLFDEHVLERANREIDIPDEAFEKIFSFFNEFDWHLDDRPLHNDREINPDVLGYIFEKYINQKQMGAYYTKEDITEYISKNTLLPFILDATEQKCLIAFRPDGPIWLLLRENPDAYIYDTVKKGCDLELPPEIEAGVHDVAQRGEWNKSAPEEYALPTETWREVVARRTRYQEIRALLVAEKITSVNDLITYNLDIRHFVEDVITYCTSTDLLRALYESISRVTVLDPTCGSGAFLFAALNILEGLYEACLERMQDLVEERVALDAVLPAEKRRNPPDITHFRNILAQASQHPNRAYFIYKSIIINNLYGVDIMEEATEICKLRLFLKLVSQIEKFNDIEPLPDIDFNIRAGNTLVGFASQAETKQALEGKNVGKGAKKGEVAIQSQMIFDDRLERIDQKAQEIERAFEHFRNLQEQLEIDSGDMRENKRNLRQMLGTLRTELDGYLASEYGIDRSDFRKQGEYEEKFAQWQQSHQPFHWWVEFYGIMKRGGFNVVIGNPPYVEYREVRKQYTLKEYEMESCGNLYAYVMERSIKLQALDGRFGMIIPHSSFCTDRMEPLMKTYMNVSDHLWISTYSIRPAKLFVGVDQRLAIVIAKSGKDSKCIYSTQYHHWREEARLTLFNSLEYKNVTHIRFGNSVPKMSFPVESELWRRLSQYKELRTYFTDQGAKVYFHNAPRYWIRAMTFAPYFWNERDGEQLSTQVKLLSLPTEIDAGVVSSVINSSLFYWWFIALSDCRHLNMREIEHFPLGLDKMAESTKRALAAISKRLMDDFVKHAVRKEAFYKTTGKVIYDEFYPKYSKSIIDEIDSMLAQHYGFTDEELDFIINYDIKYRMGRNSEDEGEE